MAEVQMSFIEDENTQVSIESLVERKDFKGLLAYLKSLTKHDLHTSLLMSGFTISGQSKEWLDYNEQKLIRSCQVGLTPRMEIHNLINLLEETKVTKTLSFKHNGNMKPKLNKIVYYIYKHKGFFVVSFIDENDNKPKAVIYQSDDVYRNFRERTWECL